MPTQYFYRAHKFAPRHTISTLSGAVALMALPLTVFAQAPNVTGSPTPTATSVPALTAPAPVPVPANPADPGAPAPVPTTPDIAPSIVVPPAASLPAYVPFKQFPTVGLDEANNGIGIAQQTARTKGLQARILWIDGTANLDRINTAPKIKALMLQVKKAGFNTVVLDVKPIVGLTLYPSHYAPKLTTWVLTYASRALPADFDPVDVMVKEAHTDGLQFIANFNAFSEGHSIVHQGPGYDHPEWQTILYDVVSQIGAQTAPSSYYRLSDRVNTLPKDDQQIAVFADPDKVTGSLAGNLIVVLDSNKQVIAQVDGVGWSAVAPNIPTGGSVLIGRGAAAQFLKQQAAVGVRLAIQSAPVFVPIGDRPDRQVPLMVNPNRPEVQQRMLDMVSEVVTNYPVDGIIFDDRLRYAGINADFGPDTRAQFETYVGHPITWPDDVFRYDVSYPGLVRRILPGPQYDSWLLFRALTLRNFLASVVSRVKAIRPTVMVSTYTGSNYADYPLLGPNWAASDFTAGFHFLTSNFEKTGYAGLLDWMTTGCYYPTGTISEAQSLGRGIGETVEAAGQFSNRAVNDQTWVYAGIALDSYNGRPDALKNALQAAAASTQGIMIFDLSQNIDQFWPVFTAAFAQPALAPHTVSGLLDDIRKQHAAAASATPTPPVMIYRGVSGTGL